LLISLVAWHCRKVITSSIFAEEPPVRRDERDRPGRAIAPPA
jgi:hypothetical protein